jgi:hypothetical protein
MATFGNTNETTKMAIYDEIAELYKKSISAQVSMMMN